MVIASKIHWSMYRYALAISRYNAPWLATEAIRTSHRNHQKRCRYVGLPMVTKLGSWRGATAKRCWAHPNTLSRGQPIVSVLYGVLLLRAASSCGNDLVAKLSIEQEAGVNDAWAFVYQFYATYTVAFAILTFVDTLHKEYFALFCVFPPNPKDLDNKGTPSFQTFWEHFR
jgi:hypothetical protein